MENVRVGALPEPVVLPQLRRRSSAKSWRWSPIIAPARKLPGCSVFRIGRQSADRTDQAPLAAFRAVRWPGFTGRNLPANGRLPPLFRQHGKKYRFIRSTTLAKGRLRRAHPQASPQLPHRSLWGMPDQGRNLPRASPGQAWWSWSGRLHRQLVAPLADRRAGCPGHRAGRDRDRGARRAGRWLVAFRTACPARLNR